MQMLCGGDTESHETDAKGLKLRVTGEAYQKGDYWTEPSTSPFSFVLRGLCGLCVRHIGMSF
jgi:hypothetical protein